jgi:hypothetical protein
MAVAGLEAAVAPYAAPPAYAPNVWFPLTRQWDVQNLPPPGRFTFPMTLHAGDRILMWTDEDLLSPRGWVYAASVTANKPDVGIRLEYTSPRGRRVVWEVTARDMYNQGLIGVACPGMWGLTRWAEATPPEYVAVLYPSLIVPYQPKGGFYLINRGAEDATVYSLIVTLINLFEE